MSAASTIGISSKDLRVDQDAEMGDDVTPKTLISVVRSESLWIRDGNIVLQAEGTQFKVYQGLLALQSTIFRDMFAVPPPSTGQDQVEGCPLVHLSDAAVDIAFMLEAIFLRRWVGVGQPIPMEVVVAFLRLGNKYEIETIRDEAHRRLFHEFPSDLASFDELVHTGTMINNHDQRGSFDAANLAREQNLLSVLPIALFWCCQNFRTTEMKEGQRRADGTISTLSPTNERACFGAHFDLLKLKEQCTFSWLFSPQSPYPICSYKNGGTCPAARSKIKEDVFFPIVVAGCINRWINEHKQGLCHGCGATAKRLHEEGRQKSWDALPNVFGLPGWEELLKERSTPA